MFLFCTVTQAPEISFYSKECHKTKVTLFISLTLKTLVMIILFWVQRKSSLQLARSPDVISTSPKSFWWAELISQFFCYSNSSKNITCPSGKLKTEFTSPIAESTSPGLSDTTFFARWLLLSLSFMKVLPTILHLSQCCIIGFCRSIDLKVRIIHAKYILYVAQIMTESIA